MEAHLSADDSASRSFLLSAVASSQYSMALADISEAGWRTPKRERLLCDAARLSSDPDHVLKLFLKVRMDITMDKANVWR